MSYDERMTQTLSERVRPSSILAAEIRASVAREGVNMAELARRLDVPQAWVSRRIGRGANIDITLDEAVQIAEALNISVQGLFASVLPRLDSNQQPSGYAGTRDLFAVQELLGHSRPETTRRYVRLPDDAVRAAVAAAAQVGGARIA